ncbi:MAG: thioesterase family protein [Selenomonadaceae bacterium]|nr:thioesterase family protein [Selenomonadaceae bacterium]
MSYENLIGLTSARESLVTEKNTALALKSGSLKVLATPEMIRLIEETSAELVEKNLPPELTSVGISLDIKHTAPTPVGMKFRAEVKIISVDGRKIVLEVAAFDERGQIGHGVHERFIVDGKKFQSKADEKLSR